MKRFIVSLVCAMLVIFLFSGPVAEAETSNYAVLKAGAYFPNSADLNGFDTGFNGEYALGHYFSKNIAAELGVGYFQSSGNASASASAKSDIYATPLTLAVKAIYPVDRYEIYAIGGVGAYLCNAKINAGSTVGNVTFSSSQRYYATSVGGFLGAGADVNIDKNWFIGLEGKHLWTHPEFTFSGQRLDVKFGGWVVTGNVGFRF